MVGGFKGYPDGGKGERAFGIEGVYLFKYYESE